MNEPDDFRSVLSGLPKEASPDPKLEDRTVLELQRQGLLLRPGFLLTRWWLAAAAATVVLGLFGAFGAGHWQGSRQTQNAMIAMREQDEASSLRTAAASYVAALADITRRSAAAAPQDRSAIRQAARGSLHSVADQFVRLAPEDPMHNETLRKLSTVTLGLMLATAPLVLATDHDAGSIGVTFRGGAGRFVVGPAGERIWRFGSPPRVTGIAPDGPAVDVVEIGDVVLSVDGNAVTTLDASRTLQRPWAGQSMQLELLRGDLTLAVELVAAKRTASSPTSAAGSYSEASEVRAGGRIRSWLGMGLEMRGVVATVEKDGYHVYYFDEPPTVYTVDAGGPASRAGLQRGDLLLRVDGLRIDREEGGELFSSVEPGREIRLTFRRLDQERTTALVPLNYSDLGDDADPTHAGSAGRLVQNLRYAGSLGDTDIEVRGLGRVVISRLANELTIRIDDAVVTLSREE